MSNPNNYAYPFDPTGNAATNRIQGERQVISAPNWSDFYFIIPLAAPFFRESMQLIHHPSGRILAEGVDYVCTHRFHDASLAVGKPIYGSITFYDKTLSGVVEMNYQTIGGAWTLPEEEIIEILSNKLLNPRITVWEQVTDLPFEFPVIDHEWELDDMVGASEIVAAIEGIRDAIMASGEGGLGAHLADFNNPHQTTKAQVGLGNVQNLPLATLPDAQAGTSNDVYMTALRTAQAIQTQALTPLNTHTANFNNPHQTTAAQVGLGSVANYPTASQTEAEGGTANNRFMTPLRTAQAIAALATGPMTAHINNTNNPHGTTKAQVGLSLVQNYAIADALAARAGTANDLYMTPAMVREAISAQSGGEVVEHVNNTNNPHQVTASQVGLGAVQNYGVATQTDAQNGTANNVYMTPLRTSEAIQQVMTPVTAHINATNNPHQVTKAQVGLSNVENLPLATQSQAESGTSDMVYMTPLRVAQAIAALADPDGAGESIAAHVSNTANPHSVTKAQVGLADVENYAIADQAAALAGTSNVLYMTPLRTREAIDDLLQPAVDAHANRTDNPHGVTAAQVGAPTIAQVNTALGGKLDLLATAANSTLLQGLSAAQIIASAQSRYEFPAINALEVDDGSGGTITINDGITYTRLASWQMPGTPDPNNPPQDLLLYVTGGEARTETTKPISMVQVDLSGTPSVRVFQIGDIVSSSEYGVTVEDDEVSLWMKNPVLRNGINVAVLSRPSDLTVSQGQPTDDEPAGITYGTVSMVGSGGGSSATSLDAGSLVFGTGFGQAETGTGPLWDWMNVIEDAADLPSVQTRLSDFREEIHAWRPVASTPFDRAVWAGFEQTGVYGGATSDTGPSTGLTSILSPYTYSDFTLEVDLDTLGSQDENGAIGVVAAYIEVNGQPHAIHVLRSMGSLVREDNNYKLLTVAYNAFTGGMIDLGSVNGALEWGDGVVNDTRDPTAYSSTGVGFGPSRLSIVRSGNIITVKISQVGSTDIESGEEVVIDLASNPALAVFMDKPCYHGLAVYKQQAAKIAFVARPDMYEPYYRIILTTSPEGVQRDTSQIARWLGAGWSAIVVGPSNRFMRPGRIYYSDWNGHTYVAQRDGTLRQMYIEAYSRSGQTFITE